METIFIFTLKTQLGLIYAAVNKIGLCVLSLPPRDKLYFINLLNRYYAKTAFKIITIEAHKILAGRQLINYFERSSRKLNAPMDLKKISPFGQLVVNRLLQVPYGQTISYGQLAMEIRRPNAARAVGKVLHYNPIPLFIPCHRVIGTSGALIGFNAGIETKKALLLIESNYS